MTYIFFKNLRLTFLWALFIATLCAIPGSDLPKINWLDALSIDKLVHFLLFFILIILLLKAVQKNYILQFNLSNHVFIVAIISVVFYGGILEILQEIFFKQRYADWYDFYANTFGVFVGALVYRAKLTIHF